LGDPLLYNHWSPRKGHSHESENALVDEHIELKGLPHNDEAERVLLGSMLLDSANIAEVMEQVALDSFYRRGHQLIYKAIVSLSERSQEVDPVLAAEELATAGELQEAGGYEYLDELTQGIPRTANVMYYAGIVREKARLRNLARFGQEVSRLALDGETGSEDVLTKAETSLFDLREGNLSFGFRELRDLLSESYQIIEERSKLDGEMVGLGTGFLDFDRMTNGLQKGDLIIVAARPAMGKTSFCLNLAMNAGLGGARVVIYSLEMPSVQLATRLIGSEARVGISALRSGNLHEDQWSKVAETVANLSHANIFIDDRGDSSVARMRAELKRLSMEEPIDLVVIDYLQLMTSPGGYAQQSRVQEVSAISRGLKILAKEINCPVIALSQLSRAAEQRSDHRPQLSDLRESGSIEQDADMVCFLFREDYYKEKTDLPDGAQVGDEDFGLAELIIAKHRNGPTGKVKLAFFKRFTRFENYSDDMDYMA